MIGKMNESFSSLHRREDSWTSGGSCDPQRSISIRCESEIEIHEA
jgi:hypothetical protein